jgi:hypothetical protein
MKTLAKVGKSLKTLGKLEGDARCLAEVGQNVKSKG